MGAVQVAQVRGYAILKSTGVARANQVRAYSLLKGVGVPRASQVRAYGLLKGDGKVRSNQVRGYVMSGGLNSALPGGRFDDFGLAPPDSTPVIPTAKSRFGAETLAAVLDSAAGSKHFFRSASDSAPAVDSATQVGQTALWADPMTLNPNTSGLWSAGTNGTWLVGGAGRHGTSVTVQSDCHGLKVLPTTRKTLAFGMAVTHGSGYTVDTDGDDFGLVSFCGDAGAVCHVFFGISSNTIYAARGRFGTLLATATAPLLAGQWNYVAIEVTIDDTAGAINLQLDGLNVLSFTGDTRNGGTNDGTDSIRLGGYWPNNMGIDDLYLATHSLGDPGDVSNLTIV